MRQRRSGYFWVFWILLFLLLIGWLVLRSLTPDHEGDWAVSQRQLPLVEQSGDGEYRIRYLRDFRYHPDRSVADARYIDDVFRLEDLQTVWLGISHFGPLGLAHTFLSFEFSDDRFLVASIEARLKTTQLYSPLKGLLRQYHKIIVLGTEADIIGLRTHIRQERVLLYPLQLERAEQQYLLRAILQDADELERQAAFYNTLMDNCLTNLIKHDPTFHSWLSLTDYRLVLPGFSDGLAYDREWITTAMPLKDVRRRARVSPDLTQPDAADFSRDIRRGWSMD